MFYVKHSNLLGLQVTGLGRSQPAVPWYGREMSLPARANGVKAGLVRGCRSPRDMRHHLESPQPSAALGRYIMCVT